MIEVNNLTKFKIEEKILKEISSFVLKKEKRELSLSIAFVSPGRIKELNSKYRKIKDETDILSFSYEDEAEIIICPKEVQRSAKKRKVYFDEELAEVLIHGILHVLGYDHEKGQRKTEIMAKKQAIYTKEILKNLKRR